MLPTVVYYQQAPDQPPVNYYDPHLFLAEIPYTLQPGQTVLIVLRGRGYRFGDDTIQPLRMNQYDCHLGENNQLCLWVKNDDNAPFCLRVGRKTPLVWLLDLPRLQTQLCYCDYNLLNLVQLQAGDDLNDEVDDDGRINTIQLIPVDF